MAGKIVEHPPQAQGPKTKEVAILFDAEDNWVGSVWVELVYCDGVFDYFEVEVEVTNALPDAIVDVEFSLGSEVTGFVTTDEGEGDVDELVWWSSTGGSEVEVAVTATAVDFSGNVETYTGKYVVELGPCD